MSAPRCNHVLDVVHAPLTFAVYRGSIFLSAWTHKSSGLIASPFDGWCRTHMCAARHGTAAKGNGPCIVMVSCRIGLIVFATLRITQPLSANGIRA